MKTSARNHFSGEVTEIKSGAVKVAINQRVPLKDAAKAQEALAGKKTTGATVLIP